MNLLDNPSTRFLLMSTTALLTCEPMVDRLQGVLCAKPKTPLNEFMTSLLLDGDPWRAPTQFTCLLPREYNP